MFSSLTRDKVLLLLYAHVWLNTSFMGVINFVIRRLIDQTESYMCVCVCVCVCYIMLNFKKN